MKNLRMVAQACSGLLAIGITTVGASAASLGAPVATMTLVSTDTSSTYPFATLVVGNSTYHVTQGDVIDGLHVRSITPGRIAFSDSQSLEATEPGRDIVSSQVAVQR